MIERITVFQAKPRVENELKKFWKEIAVPILTSQKGCDRVCLLKSTGEPDRYAFITDWESQEALQKYFSSDAFNHANSALRPLIAQRPEPEIFEVLG